MFSLRLSSKVGLFVYIPDEQIVSGVPILRKKRGEWTRGVECGQDVSDHVWARR